MNSSDVSFAIDSFIYEYNKLPIILLSITILVILSIIGILINKEIKKERKK